MKTEVQQPVVDDLFATAPDPADAVIVSQAASEPAALMLKILAWNSKENNPSLSEALDLYRQVEDALIESGGLEELGDLLDAVNIKIEQKLDNCKGLMDYWKGQVDYLDQREKMFSARKKGVKNGIEWLRYRMRAALLVTGKDKVKTNEGTYYFMKPKSPVQIVTEHMTERYAAALQKLGFRRHSVVITIPSEYGGKFESMAAALCEMYPGASWKVTEPEYDIEGIHARWTGGDGGRKWPEWLKVGEKAFVIK